MKRVAIAAATLVVAAIGAATLAPARPETHPYTVIDGDTFETGTGDRIRLASIDAPEMPGHCRPGRDCVKGDPYAAKDALKTFLLMGDIFCHDHKRDRWNRRISTCVVYPTGQRPFDLETAMLATGTVGYYRSRGQ